MNREAFVSHGGAALLALALLGGQGITPAQADPGERMQAHRVIAGDSWQGLAMRLNVSVRQLKARYNPDRAPGPLHVGEMIWLPSVPRSTAALASVVVEPRHRPKSTVVPKSRRVTETRRRGAGFKIDPDPRKAVATGNRLVSSYLDQGVNGLKASGWAPLRYMQVDYRLPLFADKPRFSASSLVPLVPGQRLGWFPQYHFDYRNERITTGMGMTYQTYLTPDWIGRFNSSLDYQPEYGHQRASLGLGFEQPGFSLVMNQYFPLSGWQSDYQQRPASGLDLRAQTEVPFFPSLSLVGSYYDWQGQGLALYGAGDAYGAASAFDLGVRFQPFNSLSLAWDQHHNSKGRSSSRWWLNLNLSLAGQWRDWFEQVISVSQSDLCLPFLRQGVMVLQSR